MRFQEYYESPRFKGKIFTREEFAAWYVDQSIGGKGTGQFTYLGDWAGFNIPSSVLEPFYQGKFDPLTDNERALIDLFEERRNRLFYVFASDDDLDENASTHEIAHALFYVSPDYKSSVLRILSGIDEETRRRIKIILLHTGYHEDVVDDEMHAYMISDPDDVPWSIAGLGKSFDAASAALQELFKATCDSMRKSPDA